MNWLEESFNKMTAEDRKLFEAEWSVKYKCIHNYIQQDMNWKRCEKCGEIKPVLDL